MSPEGWEGEGWGCLGSHKSLSPVCIGVETWVFEGKDQLGEGLSYFDSAVILSTTPRELGSGTKASS